MNLLISSRRVKIVNQEYNICQNLLSRMHIIVVIILITICLGSAQTERWVYQYNGLGDSADCAYSIVQGQDGNIFLAGDSYGTGTEHDFIIISLTSSGAERWVYRYNGAGNSNDGAYSIVYGQDGNIYAAGYSSENSAVDFTVISLTPAGTQRWVYQYNGPGNSDDRAHSIVYGEDGNI
jgi:lipopolysaccharide export LptBFGC system permease protein LptF